MDDKFITSYPRHRIKASDGLALTAKLWTKAHATHHDELRYHTALAHGMGVVAGLQVKARTAPDQTVFIYPGVAVDDSGQAIVVPELVSFSFDESIGHLYLSIRLGPEVDSPRDAEGDLPCTHRAYTIVATTHRPVQAHVELARITRTRADAPVLNAAQADRPRDDEIDLRFRPSLQCRPSNNLSMAVCYLGLTDGVPQPIHGEGAARLCASLSARSASMRAWVDDGIGLPDPRSVEAALLYLVVCGSFKLSARERDALSARLMAGRRVFVEIAGASSDDQQSAAEALHRAFAEIGRPLAPIAPDHAVFSMLHLFPSIPDGFAAEVFPLWAAEGVVASRNGYGALWYGCRQAGSASRETVRSGHEFGENLLTWAAASGGQP